MNDCMEEDAARNNAWLKRVEALERENIELRQRCEQLKMQAQIQAMEARGANHTIGQIYQIVSRRTGEPGNWNGAVPVEAEIGRLRALLTRVDGAFDAMAEAGYMNDSRRQLWNDISAATRL